MSKHLSRSLTVTCLLLAIMLGAGCAYNQTRIPSVHKVQAGESLSSIAIAYGLDWKELARWNEIAPPYTIYVGQRLSLDPFPPLNYAEMERQIQSAQKQRSDRSRSGAIAIPEQAGPSISRLPTGDEPGSQQASANQQAAGKAPDLEPVILHEQAESQAGATLENTAEPEVQAQPAPPPADPEPATVNAEGWRWPLAQSVLDQREPKSIRQGINLYATEGTPIYAARNGEVVYSGVGLQGFGQLVILKHDGDYLSAYGYARNAQVEEGDRVAVGDQIAEIGLGPGDEAVLHFEIRHDGQPIPPDTVLP
ncbi:MAG TPA: M23 family metallopeptidase [Salinisphaeraceae bacterium]|nr:M23 family metallopeptidase [Salinisphaeraceae bacterium]